MFLNFTNHPAAGWSAEQRRAALAYGVILDLPFPDVPPECSTAEVAVLADAWAARILAMHPDCVLCQGEMTLTARVVQLLREHGVELAPVPAAEAYLQQGCTVTYAAADGSFAGFLALSDTLRPVSA